jgi:hypothetical protein
VRWLREAEYVKIYQSPCQREAKETMKMKMSRRWRSLAAFALAVSMLAAPAAHAAAAPVAVTAVKDGWISQDGSWY